MKQPITILSLTVALIGSAHASTLTGSVNNTPATSANLTTDGALDWAIWDTTDGTAVASVATTNTRSGGTGLISSITAFSTGTPASNNLRGVGGATQLFTYTDGTSPTAETNQTLGFVANSTLGALGRGVQLFVTGDSSQLYHVEIWTVGYLGQGQLTASLSGADDITLFSQTYTDNNGLNKASTLFSFDFTPDDNLDLLNISYHLSTDGSGSSNHVGIQAVTVSVVPEPGTYALIAGCLSLGAVMIRRRRV